MSLIIPQSLWRRLLETIRDDGIESAGIALANRAGDGAATKFILSELRLPASSSYTKQGALEAELAPEFVASVVREARDRRMSTIFFHTHPFSEQADFSPIDDAGERLLLQFVERRVPGLPHAALVLGRTGPSARLLGTERRIGISVIGPVVQRFEPLSAYHRVSSDDPDVQTFDRQIRAFGVDAQRRLGALRVGIVGLGGTGSIAAEQLAHLGVASFLLVDADTIDESSLNRVVGASPGCIGRPKVHVASELIQRIRPSARVESLHANVLRNDILSRLRDVDALFGCTDSHGSRYVLNELAYRFLLPCFDCGVVILTGKAGVTHISARAQMLAPGLSCLTCGRVLDPEQVRRDLLTDFERARDPYIVGGAAPQPAVVSLNGVVVSLAITMFLGAFSGLPLSARHQRYDAIRGTVRNIDTTPVPDCITCSAKTGLAVGDSWPLPGRPE